MDYDYLTDKHIQRITEYLARAGWTDAQILDFIKHITK